MSYSIYLVEDDPGDQELIKRYIHDSSRELTVQLAENGVEALTLFGIHKDEPDAEAQGPDLLLLDLKLPKVDGFEVLEEIRQYDCFASVPIIILTTINEPNTLNRAYRLGASSCIVKPDRIQEIERAIHLVLEYWLGLVHRPEV